MAHGAGEEEAESEFRRGEPVVDPRRPEVGIVGDDAHVGRQGEAEPPADRGAVDRGDHRLVQPADGADHVVEHLHGAQRDRRQGQALHVGHRPGIFVVGAGAETAPRSRDDDDPHVVVVTDVPERVAERDHHVEGHGVHSLGPIQSDDGDVLVGLGDFGEGHGRGW